MTLRRIHTKQCRAALGDLEQKQPTPDVAILEGLGVKSLLQLVELNQLQGQCAAEKLIAIKLDRMPVQGRIHLIDRGRLPTPLRPPLQRAFFALFAGFIATMTRSDFSHPCIIGVSAISAKNS